MRRKNVLNCVSKSMTNFNDQPSFWNQKIFGLSCDDLISSKRILAGAEGYERIKGAYITFKGG